MRRRISIFRRRFKRKVLGIKPAYDDRMWRYSISKQFKEVISQNETDKYAVKGGKG